MLIINNLKLKTIPSYLSEDNSSFVLKVYMGSVSSLLLTSYDVDTKTMLVLDITANSIGVALIPSQFTKHAIIRNCYILQVHGDKELASIF